MERSLHRQETAWLAGSFWPRSPSSPWPAPGCDGTSHAQRCAAQYRAAAPGYLAPLAGRVSTECPPVSEPALTQQAEPGRPADPGDP
jgi:hypothetical protein